MKNKWEDMTSKEREVYINQDYISQKETLWPNFNNFDISDEDPSIWGTSKSNNRLIYELYYLDNMEVSEIIYHVKYAESTIFKLIQILKENISFFAITKTQKEILVRHFIKKQSHRVISETCGISLKYVYKVILSYLREYKVK